MKKVILFFVVLITHQANSQSLKDALFSGKLKNDSTVRKTDDLSKKIDTSRKKPVEPEKSKVVSVVNNDGIIDSTVKLDPATTTAVPATDAAIAKDNNKIWKEFMDSIVSMLNAEVMTAKQLKKGDYFVIVDYAIEVDGQVTIKNILPTPENKFLQDQVSQRISISPPRLNPVLGSNGQPRKTFKRYSFTVSTK